MYKISSVILAAAFTLTSCASMAPYTYQESCALKGMKLTGVSSSSGSAFVNGKGNNWATVSSYGENVGCAVPETEMDKCEVDHYQQAAMPKAKYNEGYSTKYTLSGLGYWLFIVPGVALKLAYDSELSKAEAESAKIAAQNTCGPKPASIK